MSQRQADAVYPEILSMLNNQLDLAKRAVHGVHRRLNGSFIKLSLRQRGLAGAYKIPTFTAREELEALFELAHDCPPDAHALEVGSYLGASTCFLAAGLRGMNASLVCIDTWQNETMPDGVRDTFSIFEKNIAAVRNQLTIIRKSSGEVTALDLGDRKFDIIFLDGDHSYKQTRADFDLVSDLVTPDGVLAFHDSQFFEGVSRVIGEALASGRWQIAGNVGNLFWIKRANFAHQS
jgi:predicted O-methyltransferase YrrM